MKLAHKIYFVVGIFSLPLIGLVVYFIMEGLNWRIEFAQKEYIGNEYLRPLSSLLEHVSEHQALAQRAIQGEAGVAGRMNEVKGLVTQSLAKLDEVDAKHREALQFTPEALAERKKSDANAANVRQKWQQLASQSTLPLAESRAKHIEIIDLLMSMIVHAGDKSNLILDPDLDSYYIMDMTLIRLPITQKRIAQTMSDGMEIFEKAVPTPAELRPLSVSAALFREVDRDVIVADLQISLDEDKNWYGSSPTLSRLRGPVDAYATAVSSLADLLEKSTDRAELIKLGEQTRRASFELWRAAVDELDKLLLNRIDAFRAKRTSAVMLAVGVLLIAGAISFLMIRSISRSIDSVASELHDLASGDADLTRRITVAGSQELQKLASSFNTLMGKLLALIRQVQQSGTQVTSSSTEIAASTKQLEAAVTEQAASTNEVVATTKEISATSQSLVQTMGDIGKVASDTSALAGTAQGDLDGMAATMRGLSGSTTAISTKLATISEKASNIGKIVITITKVADQTNLLSLNASIEAEKAGEHGLGFAVVAREIRRLADQTAVATLDIERMVKEMQSAVSVGVMEMDKFTKDVEQSVTEVNSIGAQLTKIIERVQTLAPRFETVSEGMQAQSQGAQQISAAMVQLSEAARQTMDSLRQSNSAIMELNAAARGLHQEVSRFRTAAE